MRASDFNFKAGRCGDDWWFLARTGSVPVEIERLGKDAFSIRRFGHGLFAADEFADLCCSRRAVVGKFTVAQAHTARSGGNKIKLMG